MASHGRRAPSRYVVERINASPDYHRLGASTWPAGLRSSKAVAHQGDQNIALRQLLQYVGMAPDHGRPQRGSDGLACTGGTSHPPPPPPPSLKPIAGRWSPCPIWTLASEYTTCGGTIEPVDGPYRKGQEKFNRMQKGALGPTAIGDRRALERISSAGC